jgi:acetyl-CoA synthetase
VSEESTSIESLMKELRVVEPPEWVSERAYIKNMDEYDAMYQRSIEDPEAFWAEQAESMLYWHKKWDTVLEYEFDTPRIEWFKGGQTNVAYNCTTRSASSRTCCGSTASRRATVSPSTCR